MQVADRISDIERRAEAVNLSLWRVSKLADVQFSTVTRWRRGDNSPTLDVCEAALGRLERTMTSIEAGLLQRLAHEHGIKLPQRRAS